MKFTKSLDELKGAVAATGVGGEWAVMDGDKHQFKAENGGILNWWSKTGTLQFQGPKTERERLESLVTGVLEGKAAAVEVPAAQAMLRPHIFVVHGHDETAREQLELVLHRLGLNPFVLLNTAGGGLTIIEALEKKIGKLGDAVFGIVLMTPDDMGYSKRDGELAIQPRARQNVILEMGMLLSSLTRARVAILVKGFVELPSDATGIIYLHFNDHVKEIVPKLAERLQACGISLSAEQISRAAS